MEPRETLPLLGFRRRKLKDTCAASQAVKRVCRERASKRWSALLTQTKSRIGYKCGMRSRLGEANWAAFVRYADAEYKADFFLALTPPTAVLCCEGRLNGAPCPKQVQIDLRRASSRECGEQLPKLHVDHTHDVKHICKVWSDALPEEPQSWDDGICGPLVAHLLFGTRDHLLLQCSDRPLWQRQIFFRCGTVRSVDGQKAEDFCHDVDSAHYEHTLNVNSIKWQTSPAPEK